MSEATRERFEIRITLPPELAAQIAALPEAERTTAILDEIRPMAEYAARVIATPTEETPDDE